MEKPSQNPYLLIGCVFQTKHLILSSPASASLSRRLLIPSPQLSSHYWHEEEKMKEGLGGKETETQEGVKKGSEKMSDRGMSGDGEEF